MKIPAVAFVLLSVQLFSNLHVQAAPKRPNLALHQPTWQSTLWNTAPWLNSNLAVDGKTENLWAQHSCTSSKIGRDQWWAVDLGKETNVLAVTILTRRLCCANHLNNVIVGLTNVSPSVTAPAVSNVQVCGRGPAVAQVNKRLAIACDEGLPNFRYVVLISTTSALSMCEVEVFGAGPDFTNLALRKPTTQSSLVAGAKADAAVDGNRNALWNAGSCTQTDRLDRHPWWAVDLGQPSRVYVVAVTNRQDPNFLNGYIVGLTNADPSIMAPTLTNVKECGRGPARPPLGQTTAVACPLNSPPSRYVVILKTTASLSMCEVEVYGAATQWSNLALGKLTWQSSLSIGAVPSNAVDGNMDSMWRGGSCTSTKVGDRTPWWAVDLGQVSDVYVVTVTNRRDCCAAYQNNFIVGLTNNPPDVTPPATGNVVVCGRGPARALAGMAMPVACDADLPPSRYVAILSASHLLTLCEVEVFGEAADIDPCQAKPCKNGGICSSDDNNKFTCSCVSGWTGTDCTTDVNVCSSGNPCLNGGRCVKFGTGYECRCPLNWAGTNCDMGSAACKAVEPTRRQNCGWGGVTPAQCNDRSCCFDDSIRNRPSCFFSSYACDNIPEEELVDCGWEGISYNQCINRGCCFNDDEENAGPICFRKANPSCVGVEAGDREMRGDSGIQPNECTAQGWCFDTSIDQEEGPWCFVRKED